MIRFFALSTLFILAAIPSVFAHEYYLMPERFSAPVGETVGVRHRLGQKFKGNELPWITKWNIRSEVWEGGTMRPAAGTDGDRPALNLTLDKPGLAVVVHQSNVDMLTFKTYEKFVRYVLKEGIEYVLNDSRANSLPREGLKEAYSRFAKTLVNVGDDTTSLDIPTGLKIELIALANPGALGPQEAMPVQVLYEGKPLASAAVKVFEGIGSDYAYQVRTDAEGKALIRARGVGPYLVNVIHMTEPQGEQAKAEGAHWESFWASLTFERKQ